MFVWLVITLNFSRHFFGKLHIKWVHAPISNWICTMAVQSCVISHAPLWRLPAGVARYGGHPVDVTQIPSSFNVQWSICFLPTTHFLMQQGSPFDIRKHVCRHGIGPVWVCDVRMRSKIVVRPLKKRSTYWRTPHTWTHISSNGYSSSWTHSHVRDVNLEIWCFKTTRNEVTRFFHLKSFQLVIARLDLHWAHRFGFSFGAFRVYDFVEGFEPAHQVRRFTSSTDSGFKMAIDGWSFVSCVLLGVVAGQPFITKGEVLV